MPKLALEVCAFILGIPLEALVIGALLRGPYRRFPFVLVYMSVFFVVTVVEAPLCIAAYGFGAVEIATYAKCYWIFEWVLMPLVFLVVISFLYRATTELPSRRTVRALLIGAAAIFAAATFAWHYAPGVKFGKWMTPWTSNLNFAAAILDLALWTFLIAARRKDDQLLMLSGGFGIQFTGQAIGESIRNLAQPSRSSSISLAGGVVIMVANLICLYIWLQAFREPRTAVPAAAPKQKSSQPPAFSDRL